MASRDRRTLVQNSAMFNGIDFVEVADGSQTSLRVHFLNALPLAQTLGTPPVTITGGESIPTVAVNPIDEATAWTVENGHLVLNLTVAAPGDFSNNVLQLRQRPALPAGVARLDPFFASSVFSFKANCPSDLDCKAAAPNCPAPSSSDSPQIDYLAKDFLSFRQALLDFSALHYPEWQERSEADFGVMFLEALCALADDFSYMQDRVAGESFLETATQRRSIDRLARLVDYWPSPTLAASVLLQFDVKRDVRSLAEGLVVTAQGPDGAPIPFETGTTLANRLVDPTKNLLRRSRPASTVSSAWNRGAILPYWFDDSQRCVKAGTSQMYVLGRGFNFFPGQLLLIETAPATSADPPVRQVVRLLDANQPVPWFEELCDPLLDPPTNLPMPPPFLDCTNPPSRGTALTLIRWRSEDALTTDRDLSYTTLAGNLIVATQALTQIPGQLPAAGSSNQPSEVFAIPPLPPGDSRTIPAVVRTGPNDSPSAPSPQYLYTLRSAPLAWVRSIDPTAPPQPELVLTSPASGDRKTVWQFVRWLLDAGASDSAFTIDHAQYARVDGTTGDSLRFDYNGDGGDTVRFGDGLFGVLPEPGTTFGVTYRVTAGAAGNVAADSVTSVEPSDPQADQVARVTNPLPAGGGADPEPLETVRRLAPQAFRASQFRSVLPADYQAVAQSLPWVNRAGSVFRWTGSWLTVFTTPDPHQSTTITANQRIQLIDLLNRHRMAGYESYVSDPDYVSIDLLIRVSASPNAFQGAVEQELLKALGSSPQGFFAHDNFTFGQPLEKSLLEATIQKVNGVAGVLEIQYRFGDRTTSFASMGDTIAVGTNQILRCDNDPSLPANGSLRVNVGGGK